MLVRHHENFVAGSAKVGGGALMGFNSPLKTREPSASLLLLSSLSFGPSAMTFVGL